MNSTKTVVQPVTDNTTKRQQLNRAVLYVQHQNKVIHQIIPLKYINFVLPRWLCYVMLQYGSKNQFSLDSINEGQFSVLLQ